MEIQNKYTSISVSTSILNKSRLNRVRIHSHVLYAHDPFVLCGLFCPSPTRFVVFSPHVNLDATRQPDTGNFTHIHCSFQVYTHTHTHFEYIAYLCSGDTQLPNNGWLAGEYGHVQGALSVIVPDVEQALIGCNPDDGPHGFRILGDDG